MLINSHDPKADGVTPTGREEKAAVRIMKNKETGDILMLVPKLREGQILDCEALAKFARPLLDEIRKDRGEPGGRYDWPGR